MSKFLFTPHIEWDGQTDPRRPWIVQTTCVYASDLVEDFIVIPVGYRTDLASVPRVPLVYWRVGGKAVLPAIVHDWLYEKNEPRMTRKLADQIFMEAMEDQGDPSSAARRWMMYKGVRLGGGLSWRRYRRLNP